MSITQTFHLNLIPEQGPTVVHCDQYDEGTGRLIIKLYDGDVEYTPSGTATIQGRKPDGHGFEYAASLSGNTVTADLTKQMTAVAGPVRCQVVVKESDDRTGTFVFILQVQKSALPDDTDMSESEYQFIEQALEDTQEYSEDAEAWAVGERGGVPVGPTDPTYHNNSHYWAQQAAGVADLEDLDDVTITTPSNNQVLTYDANTGDWINANPQSGAAALDDLTDVDITTPSNGQVLQYNSTSQEWENQNLPTPSTPDIDDLGDVNISSLADGQILKYDSNAQEWKNANETVGASDLDDLTDVSISSPTDGQFLKYDGNSGEWVNGSGGGGGATDLDDLTDVTISSPTNGQVLKYDSSAQQWKNAAESGGSGDFMGLYGMTEIQSSDGQASTPIDLDTYTTIGNYYCDEKGQISLDILSYINGPRNQYFTTTKSGAEFLLYVRTLPNGDHIQTIYLYNYSDSSSYIVAERKSHMLNGNRAWTHWAMYPSERQSSSGTNVNMPLGGLNNVTLSSVANGDALIYDSSATEWKNKPINKVTTFAVDLTGWTADTTSQSGTTLYKKQISVTKVSVASPSVDIGAGTGYVLPTTAEQESYNLLQYVTVDDTVPGLYLYASAIPTTAFYINVEGVD